MTEINQNGVMYSGTTQNVKITMPSDVTGATVKWIMARSVAAPVLITKTTGNGITISGTVITITLDPADTVGFVGDYYHEAQLTDQFGDVSTPTIGKITVIKTAIGG